MLTVCNPFSLEAIGEVSLGTWNDADKWLDTADRLHRDRNSWLPAHQRIDVLHKAATIMRDRFEELSFQIANEGGKPLIDARIEVDRAIDGVELAGKELSHLTGSEIPMDLTAAGAGRMAFTSKEPIGPVVAVSAFNHPLNLIVHQVAPAVAVGCPVIIKPADDTPLSAQSFVNILYEAGLPTEWCQYFPCDIPTAEKLVTDPRVAFFSFIGSARVGWMLRSKLAPGTRAALEHGGAAPVIIDETADLDSMIPLLAKGGFYHAGQVCVSVQRIFAPTAMAEKIATLLSEQAGALTVGNAIEEQTDVGPLIRPGEVKRVAGWVDETKDGGGKILCGGKTIGETAYAPTVVLNPDKNARLSTAEIFGPVVAVYGYDSLDEAINRANSLPFAFQAAGFTQRLDIATKLIRSLDATAVMINDHTAFRVDWMPFAGRRQSGYGTGGIGHTMHDMTQDKMAVIRL
ncbi:MAG: aldehyde dehydrogenase family protein [Alphaproteobacteria bacterium]|nr:aldehyde dehydrogenase family protein [Alphaproteobacteria bacterium]